MATVPHLLIVDDEPDTCANLSDIFTELGYRVDVAYNGKSALELVARHQYDVALLDLKMPGMDGLELYRRLRQISAGTVAIVVTAYASGDTAQDVLDAGAWRILAKPVDFGRLLPLVNEAIEQPLVLLVDDDQDLCDNLWELLRESGYRVSVAHDALSAEQLVGQREFQVVLIDMKLPQGNGAEVLRTVQKANPQARTILITGFHNELEQLVQQTMASGADAVCYKPFDVPRLLETVKRFVH